MATTMQRAPFFAKGSEEDIEAGLKAASEDHPTYMVLHHFNPDRQYPWICAECGYSQREPLKHIG